MRPGRLDRILYVGPPDKAGIEEILRIKTKNMSVENTLNLSELAELVSSGPPQAHHPPSPRIRLFTFSGHSFSMSRTRNYYSVQGVLWSRNRCDVSRSCHS